MPRRGKVSPEEKFAAVREYQMGNKTLRDIGNRLGVHHSSVEKWITLYQTFGAEGLKSHVHNRTYPKALKQDAVKCYLKSGKTLHEVSQMYGLRSLSQLQYWIQQYGAELSAKLIEEKQREYT